MKLKMKVIAALLCMTLVVGVAYAAAGSADDPLVTLSFLSNVFAPHVTEQMETMVSEKSAELEVKFGQALEQVPAGGNGSSDSTEDTGGEAASVFSVVTLTKGQVLVGDIGCEVMLRVGTAECVSSGSTGLIDITDGTVLGDGKSLVKNHLYMVTISTRSVKATAGTVKVLVRGPYVVQG